MTWRPHSSSVTHTILPVRANKDGGLLKILNASSASRLISRNCRSVVWTFGNRRPSALRHSVPDLFSAVGRARLGIPRTMGLLILPRCLHRLQYWPWPNSVSMKAQVDGPAAPIACRSFSSVSAALYFG